MTPKPTLDDIIADFDGGVFKEKALDVLKLAALGTIATGKKGSISITIDFEQIGTTSSVQVKHCLKYTKPTKNGKASEENTTSTPMYVDNLGYLTIHPQTQEDLFKTELPSAVTRIGDRNNG